MKTLFENPFILLIIIGAISSLYKKMKEGQPEDKKQGTRVSNKPINRQKALKNQREQLSAYPKQKDEERTQPKPVKDILVVHKPTPDVVVGGEIAPKREPIQIDQTNLISGLIWSEVLGPPRAKKHHRATR